MRPKSRSSSIESCKRISCFRCCNVSSVNLQWLNCQHGVLGREDARTSSRPPVTTGGRRRALGADGVIVFQLKLITPIFPSNGASASITPTVSDASQASRLRDRLQPHVNSNVASRSEAVPRSCCSPSSSEQRNHATSSASRLDSNSSGQGAILHSSYSGQRTKRTAISTLLQSVIARHAHRTHTHNANYLPLEFRERREDHT